MGPRLGEKLGNYHLHRLLGQGGFADVYLGEHHYLHSHAALKLLHATLTDEGAQRFLSEARTLVKLRHPHIVRVLEFFVEGSTPVLVMDYAPQGTLRQRYAKGDALPLATTVTLIQQAAAALQYAHNNHIIHRDIKPENMLLDAEENLLLSDFGLALFAPSKHSLSTQDMAGSVAYTAPEQLRGKPVFASDQYALGIVAYEWLCGDRPFVGGLWDVVYQHQSVAPVPLREKRPDLPLAVEKVVLRALAKTPQERFASVQAFADAFERAAKQQNPQPFDDEDTAPHKAVLVAPSAMTSETPTHPSTRAKPASSSHLDAPGLGPSPVPDKSNKPKKKRPSLQEASSNRQRMLTKVRAFWIAGVLEQSLHGAALITLGLEEKSDAVMNPWRLVLEQPGANERPLPSGTSITQVYDAAGGELLVLGEPGSGKTTLLLQLTRDLLDRAEIDEAHPLPVVFNLSSWALERQPLATWLIEELNTKYQVPRKLGQQWVVSDMILPLLDGLDEVTLQYRAACVEAINAYRREHGLLPTVVCSRIVDYLALKERILLRDAVTVQPLTTQQIDEYLSSMGAQVKAVRTALHQDTELQEIMATPLMLSIVTLAYHGMPVDDLLRTSSLDERRQHIFKTYVERMLTRRGANPRYTPQQTIHWLTWLAQQMVKRGQTVFYIERMQPDWLPTERLRRLHPCLVVGLVFGVIAALIAGSLWGIGTWSSYFNIWTTSGIGLACGLLFGLLNGLLCLPRRKVRAVSDVAKRWKSVFYAVLKALLNGLLMVVLSLGYSYVISPSRSGLSIANDSLAILNISLLGAVLFLLVSWLVGKLTEGIQPAEVLAWSWKDMGWGFLQFLLIGLWAGVLVPPLYQVLVNRFEGRFNVPDPLGIVLMILNSATSLVSVIAALGILGGFFGGLTGGLSSRTVDESNLVKPNQGIRQSARNGLIVGLIVLLTSVMISYAFLIILIVANKEFPPISTLYSILPGVLFMGLIIGLVVGIRSGGAAYLQHSLLRLLLRKSRCVPPHYTRFLDHASAHILLRKVGGGYIFVHRLLLEYFAPPNTVLPSDIQSLSARQARTFSQKEAVSDLSSVYTTMPLLAKHERPAASRRTILLGLTGLTGLVGLGSVGCWFLLPRPLYIINIVDAFEVMWSSDGKYIASLLDNGPNSYVVQVWNGPDGHYVYKSANLTRDTIEMAWSPVDHRIAWISEKGLQILDITSSFHLLTYPQGNDSATCVAWSPDGEHVAVGYKQGTVQIWNTSHTVHSPVYQLLLTEQIQSMAWSPDGKKLVSVCDHAIKIWDALSGEHMFTFVETAEETQDSSSITWSPNSQYLAWINYRYGTLVVCSVADERHFSSYKIGSGNIEAVAWAPDSKYVALAIFDGSVQVCELMSRRVVYTYRRHASYVRGVSWSPDGKYIASSSDDMTIQVWDAKKGDLIRLYWISGGVGDVQWSPDGKRIASSHNDGIRVWQVF